VSAEKRVSNEQVDLYFLENVQYPKWRYKRNSIFFNSL